MPRIADRTSQRRWRGVLRQAQRVTFQAIADTIERDITDGRFAPGARLPTHRAMAERFGVAVATVSRAYSEVQRRGLSKARVGDGTFVRVAASAGHEAAGKRVDLTVSAIEPLRHMAEIFQSLVCVTPRDDGLLRYPPAAGLPAHREAGAAWLRDMGVDCPAERVLITSGAQQGIAATFNALLEPGDVVLAESLTYHGARALAQAHRFRLCAVELDDEGLIPDAVAAAARKSGARVLYCIPTLQNPTSAVMSAARRTALVEVARTHDLIIIEDDVYGTLVPEVSRLAALAPERTVYIVSAAKALAAGLRIGFVAAPGPLLPRIEHVLAATTLGASALLAEAVCRLIADGVADRIINWKRRELAARQEIVVRWCTGLTKQCHPVSQNVWLELPPPWTADQFVARAQAEGVLLTAASAFAIDVPAPEAVRFSVGPPESQADLERALRLLHTLLGNESVGRPVI